MNFRSVVTACMFSAISGAAVAKAPPDKVVSALFRDKELVVYVCPESDGHCSVAEFGRRLESRKIDVATSPGRTSETILVEPVKKHRQYFSAIFAKHGHEYREIFAADLSMSGITILPTARHGYFVVQAVARDSYADWTEIDFVFDPNSAYYRPEETRCVRNLDGEIAVCECG
jgi:hypothetical protein